MPAFPVRLAFASTATLVALAGPAAADGTSTGRTVQQGPTIVVSCYRGPWKNQIIVDRPNPVFVESLRPYGFSYAEAYAVGQRICTDPAFLGNLEASRDAVMDALNGASR